MKKYILVLILSGCSAVEGVPTTVETPTTNGDAASTTTSAPVPAAPTTIETLPFPSTTIPDTALQFDAIGGPTLVDSDRRFMNPGWVVEHGGRIHMFANTFDGYPTNVAVVRHVSDDGREWEGGADVLWETRDVPWDTVSTLALGGYVDGDGTWNMYFQTFDGVEDPAVIGRATAPDPEGPWTVDPDPVLTPGPPGTFDDLRVMRPSVVVEDAVVYLFYVGVNSERRSAIGLATSTDGRTFDRVTEPVLFPELGWEGSRLDRPEVILVDGLWWMLYEADGRPLGAARSADGVTWERVDDRRVFDRGIQLDGLFYQGELAVIDGRPTFYLEVGTGSETTVGGWTVEFPPS
jgi:hypothetical protein